MTNVSLLVSDESKTVRNDKEEDVQIDNVAPMNVNWVALCLLLIVAWGIIGNTLVCLSILIEKRLHNVTNYFLFSMAVADLMVSLLVMPLSIVDELHNGVWPLSFQGCLAYSSADVFLCSVSIVHMSVISLDRYWGLSHPFRVRKKSKTILIFKITSVWVITIAIACPITVLSTIDASVIYRGHRCQIFSQYFRTYGSIVLFFIPFIIMAITYAKTVKLLRVQAASVDSQVNSGNGLRRSTRVTLNTTPSRLVIDRADSVIMAPASSVGASPCGSPPKKTQVRVSLKTHILGEACQSGPLIISEVDRKRSINNPMLALKAHIKRNFFKRSSAQVVASEQKATKVLGVVFASFFVCWVPFFTANITLAFCDVCLQHFPAVLGTIFLWLGYISSTINPLIYTTFNRTFRQAFLCLLKCRCRERTTTSFYNSYQVSGMSGTGSTSGQNSIIHRRVSFCPNEHVNINMPVSINADNGVILIDCNGQKKSVSYQEQADDKSML